ncbi:penicillin-binding protein [Jeotgalibacillus marinus]|uniref:Penicillin-binding protein n=1 Tax=Jeotgalibacillus marinus TaxID=86667 RepID=A0ABV3Q219_9BACL
MSVKIIRALKQNWGAYLLFIVFGALFFALLTRFSTLQITGELEGVDLAARAQSQYEREQILEAERGKILDTNGEVIAEDAQTYKLVAVLDEDLTTNEDNPQHVDDPEKTAEILAKYIDLSEEEILERLNSDKKQIEFGSEGKDIPLEFKMKIEKEELPGILFTPSLKRFYPNGIFSSHLIGFTKSEENEEGRTIKTVGEMGIEQSLNKYLKGTDGSLKSQEDASDFLLPTGKKSVVEAEDGHDVYLTLDKKIQTFLEDAMSQVADEYSPEKMVGVVVNVKTGEIFAMSQRPTFDPDTREGLENWLNDIVESTFEPGSSFKTFSLAAAIEEDVFDPNDAFESGTYQVLDQTIRDHNYGAGWGTISYLEGVQRSSNVAFAYLLEKMGENTFESYLKAFGFGSKTGVDLPNEAAGNILYNYPVEKVTTIFGQGTTVTPLQMIQAETAIANDGKMMKPHVISKIVDPNTGETVHESEPEVVGEPISKETAEQVRDVLASTVTSEVGTGQPFAIQGYDVAGKSGQAQIPDLDKGGYMTGQDNYLFSFMGMAPADDPELIVYIAIQQPTLPEGELGSVPVSKVFNPVMLNSLKYLNIESAEVPSKETVEVQDLVGENVEDAKVSLEQAGLTPVVLGDGSTVVDQSSSETSLLDGERVVLLTDGDLSIPDLTNWSVRDVTKVAMLAGLELSTSGSGYATNQSIKADTPLSGDEQLMVSFKTHDEET